MLQGLTKKELDFIHSNQLNLQAVAANVGYEFASRQSTGRAVAPEPQTFEEAVQQLRADKTMRAAEATATDVHVIDQAPEEVMHTYLKKLDTFQITTRRFFSIKLDCAI